MRVTGPTKRTLTAAQLTAAVREGGGPDARVLAAEELTDGTFNTVWRLQVDPLGPVVLKVAPPATLPLMTYERGILRTEARYLELAASRAPVPTLLHLGRESAAVDGDFLLESVMPGDSWRRTRRLSRPQVTRLRYDLGAMVGRLHDVTGTHFGYPEPSTGLRGDTWAEAFTAMLRAVLADAHRFSVSLPVPPADLEALARAQQSLLDQVDRPALVHFDLWEGNIMLDRQPGEIRVSGLLDAERAFWGDPHAEFVSLALLGDATEDEALLAGYRDGGGRLDVDDGVRRKLWLYRIYLCLIMMIEGVPRGARGPAAMAARQFARSRLVRAVRELSRATRAAQQ
jgi:aminoglycoside phosphotransferase (APT) family kinase protein